MNDELNGIFRKTVPFGESASVEWLETNNAGAFCASTIIEKHERKYHGLLVTPVEGREGRYHILSAIDAKIQAEDGLLLGTTEYPDVYYPEGWKNLDKTELLPLPSWTYSKNDVSIKKEIFMRDGESAVWIVYTLGAGHEELQADLRFLFTFRNSHELTRENNEINTEIKKDADKMLIQPYSGLPEAEIMFSGKWNAEGKCYWDYNICYETEKERGHEWIEDRFVPGNVRISLKRGSPFVIRVGISNSEGLKKSSLVSMYKKEKSDRQVTCKPPTSAMDLLRMQTRHFMLKNPSGKHSINAGYPWFGEWGRDTMIALPGLTCYNKNTQGGVQILSDYISMIKDGLLPNTLGETQGFTSYNSIDAGLLFCWAVRKLMDSGYGRAVEEKKLLIGTIRPAVESIITAFLEDRVSDAHLNEAGLLYSGSPDTQLTWMDATAWGKPVTPRYGFAVDLNALWYDAISLFKELNTISGVQTEVEIETRLKNFPGLFQKTFWLEKEGYLTDTVNENGPDCKIRPNMLFASSAAPGLLSIEQCRAVVNTAEMHLLTEMGMRTLAPDDPDFRSVYSGGPDERDSRYHQGTVWPWPLGIMIESSLNAAVDIEKKSIFWSDYLDNLLSKHLTRDGWGFVSEIFDGLEPAAGKGSFAQAWSCGEIIRAAELINRI